MKWFFAEDDFYYETYPSEWDKKLKREIFKTEKLPPEFKTVLNFSKEFRLKSKEYKIVWLPDENKISKEIEKAVEENKELVFISSYLPPDKYKGLFLVETLPNLYGTFTSQEEKFINTFPEEERWKIERELLASKLGLNIYKPSINLNFLVGMRGVKKYMSSIKNVKAKSLRAKGIFLVGLPGTGKSFSAKVAASTLGWYLVEMNLSKIMESQNPVYALHLSFKHLENLTRKFKQEAVVKNRGKRAVEYPGFVIWIDEIEKMFTFQGNSDVEKRIFGQLLTILNDINSDTGYQIKGVFWVTANNIKQIAKNNPEFLRKGRFDELFFVDTPLFPDAAEIFDLYKHHYKFLFYGERFDDRERLSSNLSKARRKVFDNKEAKYLELEGDRISFGIEVVNVIRECVYQRESQGVTSSKANRFIYTPSEIQQLCKEMAIRQKQKLKIISLKNQLDELEKEYKRVYPYRKSLNPVKKKLYEEVKEKLDNTRTELYEIVDFLYPTERVNLAIKRFTSYYSKGDVGQHYRYIFAGYDFNIPESREKFLENCIEATISLFCKKRLVLDLFDFIVVSYSVPPLAVSMKEAVNELRSQANKFTPAD